MQAEKTNSYSHTTSSRATYYLKNENNNNYNDNVYEGTNKEQEETKEEGT